MISVGRINSGIRENIIPETLEMAWNDPRTFDAGMQKEIHEKIKLTATKIAESAGARAVVTFDKKTPVTYNDDKTHPSVDTEFSKAAGEQNVIEIPPDTGSEDFAYYQERVPGVFSSWVPVHRMQILRKPLRTTHPIL